MSFAKLYRAPYHCSVIETFQLLWIKEILILQSFHWIALNKTKPTNKQTYTYITSCKRKPLVSSKDPRPYSNRNGRKVFITKQWLFYYANAISHFLYQCFGSPLPNSQTIGQPASLPLLTILFWNYWSTRQENIAYSMFSGSKQFHYCSTNIWQSFLFYFKNIYCCFLCFSFDFKPIEDKQLKWT